MSPGHFFELVVEFDPVEGTPENRIRISKGVPMREGGQRSISFHAGREEIVSRAFASWDSVYGRMCS